MGSYLFLRKIRYASLCIKKGDVHLLIENMKGLQREREKQKYFYFFNYKRYIFIEMDNCKYFLFNDIIYFYTYT